MKKRTLLGLLALMGAVGGRSALAAVSGPRADLSVTKTAPRVATVGDNLTYTITVSTNGPDSANNVVMSDPLPAGTTFVSATQTDGLPFALTTPSVGANGTVSASRGSFGLSGVEYPGNLLSVGDTLYLAGYDDDHGSELWKSDGTTAGTGLVKDIYPGDRASGPSNLTNVGGTIYFSAKDAAHGTELWKTDGTPEGTVLVKDINPGSSNSSPTDLTNVNGTLFFTANDGTHGLELWKSDGTAAGTVLVKDIYPSSSSSFYGYLTAIGSTLYFATTDGTSSRKLWRSDGTEGGTFAVGDLSESPRNFIDFGGTLYFVGYDNSRGVELWKSGGTPETTTIVKDINPGSANASIDSLAVVNGTLYFSAEDGVHGAELWQSDGTQAGTALVKDINLGSGNSTPNALTDVNGTLYFSANDGVHGTELWQSDGTEAGTALVKDINPGSSDSSPLHLTSVSGKLFFTANDGTHSLELWQSDGTEAGTTLIKDIYPGNDPANPQSLTDVNGTLFFNADDGTINQLWKSDGSEAGTVLVKSASTATFEIVVQLGSDAVGSLLNTATLTSDTPDPDTSNNSATALTKVSLDGTAPVPNISTPTNKQMLSINAFAAKGIRGNATDNLGVTQVRVKLFRNVGGNLEYWNGSSFGPTPTLLDASLDSPGSRSTAWTFATSPQLKAALTEDSYLAYVYARDEQGNQSPAASRNFILTSDDTVPGIGIATPTQGQVLPTTRFTAITGTATDNVGVHRVSLKLYRSRSGVTEFWNGSAFTSTSTTFSATLESPDSTSTNWNYPVSPQLRAALDGGAYGIQAYARDASGNRTEAVSRTFTLYYDTTRPVPHISTPFNRQTLSINAFKSLTGTATDDFSVVGVQVKLFRKRGNAFEYWNGETFGAAPTLLSATLALPGEARTQWSFPVSPELKAALDEGSYLAFAYARDAAGNRSPATSIFFTLSTDDTKPVPVISTPANKSTLPLVTFNSITGSATDNVGVGEVRLKLYRNRSGVTEFWDGSAFTPKVATFPATLESPGSSSTNWSYSVPPALKSALDEGAYGLFAYARDNSSNQSPAARCKFTLTNATSGSPVPSAKDSTSKASSANDS